MQTIRAKLGYAMAVALIAAAGVVHAKPNDVVSTSTDVLKEMSSAISGKQGIPPYVLKNAKGIAIIPNVTKAGFLVTGEHGNGVLSKHLASGEWSDPVFVSFSGGGLGLQAGAQSSDVILVFMHEDDLQNAINGSFSLSGSGTVTAGPVGEQGEASKLSGRVYSYTRSGGAFAGVALNGSTLTVDQDANKTYYDKTSVTPQDILSGKNVQAPNAQPLKQALQNAAQGSSSAPNHRASG